jgi:hypothetical protein
MVHYYHPFSDSEWVSNVFFVFFGAMVSAIVAIYSIGIELYRRANIANPVLRLQLRDNITNMASNFERHVVNVGKTLSIENAMSSGHENEILCAMNCLCKNMKDMSMRPLNDNEKKSINAAQRGVCDDITHILKHVNYLLDKVNDDVEQFITCSINLETQKYHIRSLFLYDKKNTNYECSLLKAYTASFETCIQIYKIVIKSLKG